MAGDIYCATSDILFHYSNRVLFLFLRFKAIFLLLKVDEHNPTLSNRNIHRQHNRNFSRIRVHACYREQIIGIRREKKFKTCLYRLVFISRERIGPLEHEFSMYFFLFRFLYLSIHAEHVVFWRFFRSLIASHRILG